MYARVYGAVISLTEDEEKGPMKARSDLIDILKSSPEITDAIVTIVEQELKGVQADESKIADAISSGAKKSDIDSDEKDNVLYWLTETGPDARQIILVRTIEELLTVPEYKDSVMTALGKISTNENVTMVMEWVDRGILTLNQAVYVLLFPDSSQALK
ncbi:MAG: hypothetical protein BAJATHORv1_30463 [Candidatus Thorarchaeota archaeon]|nr:MAG: hypothetical protein BAJATHORv1_30463 [Candidatus Thorarchaeota archaeon]